MGRRRSCGKRIWRSTRGWCWRDIRRRRSWRIERVRWRSRVLRLETELAILLPWLWFAHLQPGRSCSFHTCVRRSVALHCSSSQQFSSSPLYFIRQSAQCGICIAMEFQFYYPIPTTKSYSAQDLHNNTHQHADSAHKTRAHRAECADIHAQGKDHLC
jgi:hypothetical protein